MGYIAKERGRYRVRFAIRSAAFIEDVRPQERGR